MDGRTAVRVPCTPFAVHCEKIRIHLRETATDGAKSCELGKQRGTRTPLPERVRRLDQVACAADKDHCQKSWTFRARDQLSAESHF